MYLSGNLQAVMNKDNYRNTNRERVLLLCSSLRFFFFLAKQNKRFQPVGYQWSETGSGLAKNDPSTLVRSTPGDCDSWVSSCLHPGVSACPANSAMYSVCSRAGRDSTKKSWMPLRSNSASALASAALGPDSIVKTTSVRSLPVSALAIHS